MSRRLAAKGKKMKAKNEAATHTPAPWSQCCDSGYSSKCLRGVQHSRKSAIHGGPDRRTIASHVENHADAFLISAAPDLLAALKDGLTALVVAQRERPEMRSAFYDGAIGDMRAAIAKAEGR